jgi:hypothetical protein
VMSPPTETSRTKHKRETENNFFVGQSKWVRMDLMIVVHMDLSVH